MNNHILKRTYRPITVESLVPITSVEPVVSPVVSGVLSSDQTSELARETLRVKDRENGLAYDLACRELVIQDRADARAHDVSIRTLETQRYQIRLGTISSALSNNANIACSWLNNRGQGERNIDIDHEASEGYHGWFSNPSSVRARTSVRIS